MAIPKRNAWVGIEKEVDFCACGNKIWMYWHKGREKGKKIVMTQCAPCYFK